MSARGEQPGGSLSLALVTPSYAPDFELCADLSASVMAYTDRDVMHHIIVPRSDLTLFGRLAGPRTIVHSVEEYLPSTLRKVPRVNGWINLRRPYPPVRGWIAQQIVKLAAVAALDVDVALVVDSDIVLVRPISAADFVREGDVVLYRKPDAITVANLPRHVTWHHIAHQLLGLSAPTDSSFPDYIGWPCAWKPRICRDMLDRVARVGHRAWETSIGAQLHFSEMILYGVYVDALVDPSGLRISRDEAMHCVTHDAEVALSAGDYDDLLDQIAEDDLALMVSAKSGTALEVRRAGLDRWRASSRRLD